MSSSDAISSAVRSTALACAAGSPPLHPQTRAWPPSSDAPFTEEARRRGVVPFREYVNELRRGVKLSKSERMHRYGTLTVPIPVPLFLGETEAEYAEELRKWLLFREASDDLTPVQRRSISINFANKRAAWYRGDPRTMALYPDNATATTEYSDAEAHREQLYKMTHVHVKEYKLRLKCGFFESLKTLSQAQIYDRFDSVMPPIYVPLASSESPEMYEERFIKWLATTHSTTLKELRDHPNGLEERKLRIEFANLNVKGTQKFVAPPKVKPIGKRPRESTTKIEPLAKKLKRAGEEEELEEGEVTEVDEESTATRCQQPLMTPSKPVVQSFKSCSGRDSIDACLMCGCKQCLIRGSALLDEIERTTQNREFEDCSSSSDTMISPAAASIAALLLSRPKSEDAPSQLSSRRSASAKERVQPAVDPIERKLISEYDAINSGIVADERVLEAATTRLALAPVTNVQESNQRLQQSKQSQERIECEIVRRTTALAALFVYMWRHDMNELVAMLNDPTVTNVSRVKRVTHQKCAQIASQILTKQQLMDALKAQLDSVMANESTDGSDFVATNQFLSELGAKLVQAESDLQQLQAQRRLEFKTLIRCDERLRREIRSFLPPA